MDNIFPKIFSMIDIDELNSKDEFDSFIINLTNHPAPIREVCASKLEDLDFDEFLDENSIDIIVCAITDINPNVSRSVCKLIIKSQLLQNKLPSKIINKLNQVLSSFSENEIKENTKSHAKNKLLFSLYWLLEAIFYCNIDEYENDVVKILHSCVLFSDYTIREKSAQLLSKLNNPPDKLIELVKADSNFYVNFYTKLI